MLSRAILATACLLASSTGARALLSSNALLRYSLDSSLDAGDTVVSALSSDFPSLSGPHNLSVPIDHFHNDSRYAPHSDGTFPLRYWLTKVHYNASNPGPVFLLASGETSAHDRLPFLEHGIIARLSKATGGVGVVLEHRYYGTSFPVEDMGIDNMRFLSTEQALADTAYFAKHVELPGLKDQPIGPEDVPWIAYGGSYAGAFAAFLRKVYPEVFWGAIASSGVTEAIVDYWEYYEAARLYAPGDCASVTADLVEVVDRILTLKGHATEQDRKLLKRVFGLEGLAHDDDFVSVLSSGITGLQGENWDPAGDSSAFGFYCGVVGSESVLFASTRHLEGSVDRLLDVGGGARHLKTRLMNFIGYVRQDVQRSCPRGNVEECFAARGNKRWQRTDLNQGWLRSWMWQVCTEWGYFQTGSGVPKHQKALISRLIDLEYTSLPCREAFNITEDPEVGRINKYGGFDISSPRLAIIDGEADPWRAATPHRIGLDRKSTTSEPFLLIGGGAVHHWDENGVKGGLEQESDEGGLPPKEVKRVQDAEVRFVKAWVKEWSEEKGRDGVGHEGLSEDL